MFTKKTLDVESKGGSFEHLDGNLLGGRARSQDEDRIAQRLLCKEPEIELTPQEDADEGHRKEKELDPTP